MVIKYSYFPKTASEDLRARVRLLKKGLSPCANSNNYTPSITIKPEATLNYLRIVPLIAASAMLTSLTGCISAEAHKNSIQDNSTEKITVGVVQKEIRVGMSGAEVAAALGSPNIVSTDEHRREVWIYDKVSTERVYSTSSGGINALIFGFGGSGAGGIGGSGSQSAGASSSTQRTLTVIIKFDENRTVRDFAYHTSRF